MDSAGVSVASTTSTRIRAVDAISKCGGVLAWNPQVRTRGDCGQGDMDVSLLADLPTNEKTWDFVSKVNLPGDDDF